MDLPGKADTAAVSHGVTKDLARDNVERHKDLAQSLIDRGQSMKMSHMALKIVTYALVDVLGQVRDVEVGRALISLRLEASVEALLQRSVRL